MFPVANKVVIPGSPVNVTVSRLDVDATFRVVQETNGIVSVSKLKKVLVALDVIPAVYKFVVVTAFDAYRLPVTFRVVAPVVPMSVVVFAKTFVVVTAFEMYALPVTCKFEVGFAPVRMLTPVPVILAYSVEPPKKA
jgi:hypothetical protein